MPLMVQQTHVTQKVSARRDQEDHHIEKVLETVIHLKVDKELWRAAQRSKRPVCGERA